MSSSADLVSLQADCEEVYLEPIRERNAADGAVRLVLGDITASQLPE